MGKRIANSRPRVVQVIFVILYFIGISFLPATFVPAPSWPLPQARLTDLPGSTNRRPGSPVLDLGGPGSRRFARRSILRVVYSPPRFLFSAGLSLLARNITRDREKR